MDYPRDARGLIDVEAAVKIDAERRRKFYMKIAEKEAERGPLTPEQRIANIKAAIAEPLISWPEALEIAKAGFDAWATKPHNRVWAKLIDGTPAPNDITVCIAQAICDKLNQTT